ncbi:MAG: HAD hydrolase-like protein [Erysipelotrichaceae bacterium]|jgi:4-nitrophenyl phosphatase|nr:HAD hydrolase-like protein [Erysipelotrichaceae bacterium]
MLEKHYVVQMDALVRNGTALPGAVEFMDALSENGLSYVIISEQSGRTREQLMELFEKNGFHYIETGDFYTSAMAAVDYLLAKYPQWKKAAYTGGRGVRAALEQGGFTIDNQKPDVFFAAMDRNLSYKDYSDTLQFLLNGAVLISTDSRRTMRIDGIDMIGNGSVVKMLEYASRKRSVDFSRGSDIMLRMAVRYSGVSARDCLAVGDDFEKDIVPALQRGMETVLITNGEGIEDLRMSDTLHPTYIVEDLSGLVR